MPPKPEVSSKSGGAKAHAQVIIVNEKPEKKRSKPKRRVRKVGVQPVVPQVLQRPGGYLPSVNVVIQPQAPSQPPPPSTFGYQDYMTSMQNQGWNKGIQIGAALPTLGEITGAARDVTALARDIGGGAGRVADVAGGVGSGVGTLIDEARGLQRETQAVSQEEPPLPVSTNASMTVPPPDTRYRPTMAESANIPIAETPEPIQTQMIDWGARPSAPPSAPPSGVQTPSTQAAYNWASDQSVTTVPSSPAPSTQAGSSTVRPSAPPAPQYESYPSDYQPYYGSQATPSEADEVIRLMMNPPAVTTDPFHGEVQRPEWFNEIVRNAGVLNPPEEVLAFTGANPFNIRRPRK